MDVSRTGDFTVLGENTWLAAKAMVAVTAASVTPGMFGYDPFLAAFIGVGFSTLGMCAFGSLLSLAFGTLGRNRKKLFFQTFAATVIGAVSVTGIPYFMDKPPVEVHLQPIVGFAYSLFTRWMFPLVIDVLPMLVRRWFNIPAKTEQEEQ